MIAAAAAFGIPVGYTVAREIPGQIQRIKNPAGPGTGLHLIMLVEEGCGSCSSADKLLLQMMGARLDEIIVAPIGTPYGKRLAGTHKIKRLPAFLVMTARGVQHVQEGGLLQDALRSLPEPKSEPTSSKVSLQPKGTSAR